ncbi:MAG TPA: HlyD family efflux transporter periplasmic adaptor subunit [Gammaproteobacteria bacterium]|nr:HlyD family efflux transporter periplasmic adaptor subunit [Gammaproteobacteria bacterium]
MAKKSTVVIAGLVVVGAGAFLGYRYWQSSQSAIPTGIAYGNGRLEAKLADAASKEPLRIKEILVNEGDLVKPGQVLVLLDTVTLDAELAEARASVAAAEEKIAATEAAIARRNSEIRLAQIEVERARNLVRQRAGSQRELDVRNMQVESTRAALAEEQAKLETAKQDVEVARAKGATIQTRIDDATLYSTITGRVLYRLAEPGEVLGPGGKALTLVNLEDVYMEIFLPSEQAAAIRTGAEARLTVDAIPNRAAPAYVSFVSPEAQFTPKEVETRSERDKLMFRVKIQVPPELVGQFIESIKTGVRGVGYVRYDESVPWPSFLNDNLIRAPEARNSQGVGSSPTAAR